MTTALKNDNVYFNQTRLDLSESTNDRTFFNIFIKIDNYFIMSPLLISGVNTKLIEFTFCADSVLYGCNDGNSKTYKVFMQRDYCNMCTTRFQ